MGRLKLHKQTHRHTMCKPHKSPDIQRHEGRHVRLSQGADKAVAPRRAVVG